MVLLGPHPVVVEPVDHSLSAHAQLRCQLLYACLVGVGVLVVGLTQHVLLLLCEEHTWLLAGEAAA